MIVKKIDRVHQDRGKQHAQNVHDLVTYLHLPEKIGGYQEALLAYLRSEGVAVDGIERLFHAGARNLVGQTDASQRIEMMGSASQATRSPNPLSHWLLSWKETERPTPDQIDEAAELFLAHLGLDANQAIYAAHTDTHNAHLHIAVNRYDPFRKRMVVVNNGLDLEQAHQAIAIICDRQNWSPEANARYVVQGGKVVLSPQAQAARQSSQRPLSNAAAASEIRTGLMSAERVAKELVWPAVQGARTWAQVHLALAELGVEYLVKGTNGATLKIGENYVNPSKAHRDCGRPRMEKRLGEYKPRIKGVEVRTIEPWERPMPGAVLARGYHEALSAAPTAAERAAIRCRKSASLAEIDKDRSTNLWHLDRLDDGGLSPERSALSAAIKDKASNAKAAAKRAAAEEEKALTLRRRHLADYEAWLRSMNEHYLAERWRKRNRESDRIAVLQGDRAQALSASATAEKFRCRAAHGCMLWSREGEPTAFIEWPDRVEVARTDDREAILAAFHVAHAKHGSITLFGPAEFQALAAEVIIAEGMGDAIRNPEFRLPLAPKPLPALPTQREEPAPIISSQVQVPVVQSVAHEGPDLSVQQALKDRRSSLGY